MKADVNIKAGAAHLFYIVLLQLLQGWPGYLAGEYADDRVPPSLFN